MAGAVNLDQFEAYFRRADLDGDGRISGAEAVTFFQGSNLPKHVLAQIWTYADQAKSGFLGRAEFYNALKLVTVAQSKRELTPDIVKAALYGPAAAKIPAPQINISATTLSTPATSTPQMAMPALQSSQSFGFRPQGFASPGASRQYFPPLQNQMMRPAQPTTASSAPRPPQGISAPEMSQSSGPGGLNAANSNVASDWLSGRKNMAAAGPRVITPSISSAASAPQAPVSSLSHPPGADSKALVPSGNGPPSNSGFGTDLFSATSSIPKQKPAGVNFPASTPASSAMVPASNVSKTSANQNALDSFSLQPGNSQFQLTETQSSWQPTSGQTTPGSTPTSSTVVPISSGIQTSSNLNALNSLNAFSSQPTSGQFQPTQRQSSVSPSQQVPGINASNNLQPPWPKMKPSDIQKYAKVFMEVDTDKDGKITGEQARNLFLSWRLPREVLKQVWDLSDQDNDGMLALREFSFALYLMERYREGRPFPPALPNNILFDETLLSMTGQPKTVFGHQASGLAPVFGQQNVMPGAQSMPPAVGQRTASQGGPPVTDGLQQPNQQKPVLEDSFLMDNGEDDTRNSKGQEPVTAEKKETENVILDSKEKVEYYRTKMQELVLYKSRCDNRLNEITERASADKREAESLAKKYEEKYKQVAEIASKLTVEEAKFRDIQERKMEFQQAIIKMEQGGSADGILQVRADRVQSDLEALMRALKERCSKHGINVKSISVVELPSGWHPGTPEVAAEWNEDWDKFEDEGFLNDLAIDGKKATPVQKEENFIDDDYMHDSSSNVDINKEHLSNGDHFVKSESVFNHSDNGSGRSPHDSPIGRSAFDSPIGRSAFDSPVGRAAFDSPDDPFRKGSGTDAETHRSFDDSTWGAFDNNDDVDSVWGFNKDSDLEKTKDLFGSDDFKLRTGSPHGSPHGDSVFKTKSPFMFEDSVPGTPVSRFGNSPRYSEAGDHFFDNMSSFDSFSMHDSGYSAGAERFTRFDSISSSKDFGFSQDKFTTFDSSKDLGFAQDKFSRFDSMSSSNDFGFGQDKFSRFDSISNSRDFGYSNDKLSRSDSMSSSKDLGFNSGKLTRFDSTSSAKDFGHGHAFSFDEPDPFGSSGPFKVSSDNQTPKNSDNWKAF